MGWDFTNGASKADVVEDIKKTIGERHVASEVVGNEFWVVETTGGVGGPHIVLFLLDRDPGFGWGYKDMTESMGPFYYGCPEEYLAMCPVTNQKWRDQWKENHAEGRAGGRPPGSSNPALIDPNTPSQRRND
jgi:hypothetical protein